MSRVSLQQHVRGAVRTGWRRGAPSSREQMPKRRPVSDDLRCRRLRG